MSGLTGRLANGVIHNVAEIQSHEGPSQYPTNNTIPGSCYIAGELRGLHREPLERLFHMVQDMMQTTAQEYGGTVEFEVLVPYQPYSLSSDSAIITHLQEANPNVKFSIESCDGSTHSNLYNANGIESVVIGAGARNPHAHDEYLVISEMTEAANLIARYVCFRPERKKN